jgi:hypothetical protein
MATSIQAHSLGELREPDELGYPSVSGYPYELGTGYVQCCASLCYISYVQVAHAVFIDTLNCYYPQLSCSHRTQHSQLCALKSIALMYHIKQTSEQEITGTHGVRSRHCRTNVQRRTEDACRLFLLDMTGRRRLNRQQRASCSAGIRDGGCSGSGPTLHVCAA